MTTATPKAVESGVAHKYHITLADGSERDFLAYGYRVEGNGALSFHGAGEDKTCTYAPTTWLYVEQERKDDRGT